MASKSDVNVVLATITMGKIVSKKKLLKFAMMSSLVTMLLFSSSAAHAAKDSWILTAIDGISKAPISGVLMKLTVFDGKRYANLSPIGSCTTGSNGACILYTERDEYVNQRDTRWISAKIDATSEGYGNYSMSLSSQKVTDGEVYLQATMKRAPSTSFTISGVDGKPIDGVSIAMFGGKSSCVTDLRGECSLQFSDVSAFFTAKKQGYVDFTFPNNVTAGERQVGVLKTIDEERIDRERAEKVIRMQQAEEKDRRQGVINNLPDVAFCAAYGRLIRKESLKDLLIFQDGDEDTVLQQIKRRRISVNKKLVEKTSLRMGMSDCDLMASWGYPDKINSNVGPWGRDNQYVYRELGAYIYSRNGIVTSWQN